MSFADLVTARDLLKKMHQDADEIRITLVQNGGTTKQVNLITKRVDELFRKREKVALELQERIDLL
jgi:hypothetical protein